MVVMKMIRRAAWPLFVLALAACSNPFFDRVQDLVDGAKADRVVLPSFNPPPGTYNPPRSVTIGSTPGAVIHYTTDGSTPTSSSPEYKDPIALGGIGTTMTIKAFAEKSGMTDSDVAVAAFAVVSAVPLPVPVFNPDGGRLGHLVMVSITCAAGATIAYTVDGSTPAVAAGVIIHGTKYTGPFSLPYGSTTVQAIAFQKGWPDSPIQGRFFSEPVYLYVACNADDRVYGYIVNLTNGNLDPAGAGFWPTGSQPTCVVADPGGRFLYSTDQGANTVTAFTIHADDGTLSNIGTFGAAANAPAVALVDPLGQFLYVASNSLGSFYNYPINGGGFLGANGPVIPASTPCSFAIDPDDKFLYVAENTGADVQGYTIASGVLTSMGAAFPAGLGAVRAVIHPSGHYLYVANAGDGTISAYVINPGDGTLASVPGSPFGAGTSTLSLVIDMTGNYLIEENCTAANNVRVFNIDSGTGALAGIGPMYSAGNLPVAMVMDPSGNFVYVANSGSNDISLFRFDRLTGALSPMGTYSTGSSPAALAITGSAQ
jgi:6-phosphogluconolactonase (cycloisomerase 2 family)